MGTLEKILTSAASGLSAESIHMNTIASNLANANNVGPTEESTYHAKIPQFEEVKDRVIGLNENDQPVGGVRVTKITNSTSPLEKKYDPDNPMANDDGFVFVTDVNPIEQMADMIESSRSYQANIEIMNTTKGLIMQTINLLNTK